MIKNLIYPGAGVKGELFVGATKALETAGLLKGVENVAGVSAGSLAGTLLTMGYSADKMRDATSALDFSKIKDGFNPFRFLYSYGVYKGDYVLSWIKKEIADTLGDENATFGDFKRKGLRKLSILAACIQSQNDITFNCDTYPDVIVAEAARASMCIPGYFKAFSFSKGIDPSLLFIDGGTWWNYPVDLYDQIDSVNGESLMILPWDYQGIKKQFALKRGQPGRFVKGSFEMVLNSQKDDIRFGDPRIVFANDFGIAPTDFLISKDQKDQLYQSGLSYTTKFIQSKIL